MTNEKFILLDTGLDFSIKDTETKEILTDEEIVKKLNDLHRFKNKFKALSTNAHNFLKCYEKAIEELYDKYPNGPERQVLDELDELYSKYENEVDLKWQENPAIIVSILFLENI